MANKKTVVQMYEELLALPNLTQAQKDFLNKRIEITKKKNESGKNADPTPKQKEKMAEYAAIENAIVKVMAVGTKYTPTDLLKLVEGLPADYSTQRLTPRLTALCDNGKVVKETIKGRTMYSLPAVDTADEG